MNIASWVILAAIYTISAPFVCAGYVYNWIAAFWYFGLSASARHQNHLIALSDKRRDSSK